MNKSVNKSMNALENQSVNPHVNKTLINNVIVNNNVVLIKVDYNISSPSDIFRIEQSKETINSILGKGFKVVLMTHLGRPKAAEEIYSTRTIIDVVSNVLEHKVEFLSQFQSNNGVDYINIDEGFKRVKDEIINSKNKIFLLENVRFAQVENSMDKDLRMHLALNYRSLGSLLVDEAFSVSHRNDITNTELRTLMNVEFGSTYKKEVLELSKLKSPTKPFYLYMGGAKVETKLPLIKNLLPKVDKVFIGGMICFTFLYICGLNGDAVPELFNAPIEYDYIEEVKEIYFKYKDKITLPVDFIYEPIADQVIPGDIGPLSAALFANSLIEANTVFWNGAFGQVESKNFDYSTKVFVKKLIESECISYVGGGDTESILTVEDKSKITFVSTGGGATLDFITKL